MAFQQIDLTTTQPNGKPGDPARTAFTKVNNNFIDAQSQINALSTGVSGAATSQQLVAEATARQDADTALQQNINAKASQAALQAEIDARVAGDTALTSRVAIMQGFKNKIINGDFRHWQRGTNYAAATGVRFTADRWAAVGAGSTISVAIGSASSVAQLPNSRNTLVAAVNSVAGAANAAYLQTRIEGVETLSGGNATFSIKARCTNGTFRVGVELAQNFGQGGSAQVNAIGQAITLTTSWQTFTFTVALPSVTGKTVGADNNLQLTLWLDAGSGAGARSFSAGQKTGTVEFAEVQLEAGTVATSYEFLPDAISTVLVTRYYEVVGPTSFTGTAYTPNGEVRGQAAPWSTIKRATPTVTYTGNPSCFAFGRSGELVNASPGSLTIVGDRLGWFVRSMSNYANFQNLGAVINISSGANLTVVAECEL